MSLYSNTIPDPPLPDAELGARDHRARDASHRGPVVVEVRDLDKTFRIPEHRIDSLKERAVRPLHAVQYRDLRALRGVSFDVHQGEFFGIVGRNGSGKSTLLKILASIYRADAGRVRMAGRVAPFIELGVGFNPELTARENGVLNGVLMGLTMREARRRLAAVIEFAELEDFVDLKLKNYSSGMMVRFAFSIMVQADADVMLIDEVLAVGDAAFAQKCMDVFYEKRRAGTTIVLVTHDMGTVQSLCHRAMLLHDGELRHIGSPEDTALRYYRLNFAELTGETEDPRKLVPDRDPVTQINARIVHAGIRTPRRRRGRDSRAGHADRRRRRARGGAGAGRSPTHLPRRQRRGHRGVRILAGARAAGPGGRTSAASGGESRTDWSLGATTWTAGSVRTSRSRSWACSACACSRSWSTGSPRATAWSCSRPISRRPSSSRERHSG